MTDLPAEPSKPGLLPEDDYARITRYAPLPAIDIVLHRSAQVLLGRRRNRPAAGWWFMPGGRVRKAERLADAFARICLDEMGLVASIRDARFLGIVEHFYPENAWDDRWGTHCMALVYALAAPDGASTPDLVQHQATGWWSVDDWSASPTVHAYTKETLALAYQAGLLLPRSGNFPDTPAGGSCDY